MHLFFKTITIFTLFFVLSCSREQASLKPRPAEKFSRKKLTPEEQLIYISATIYYVMDFSELPIDSCSPQTEISLKRSQAQYQSLKMCKKFFDKCLLQGTCFVQIEGQKTLINYHKKINSRVQFQTVDTNICPYGLGDASDGQKSYPVMCLDPFRSIAADLSIYRLGTVVYIREVDGVILPSGQAHDGYFIVRDSGGGIKGPGRFDFFTGLFATGKQNVFSRIGLGGEANFEYRVVTDSEAAQIRQRSGFPRLKDN